MHLGNMLASMKAAIKHKSKVFHCRTTKFNTQILNILQDTGVIDGFGASPYFKYKTIVYVNQIDYFRHVGKSSSYYLAQAHYIRRVPTLKNIRIYYRRSDNKALNAKTIRKLCQKNPSSIFLFNTVKGLLTNKEILSYGIGGVLILKLGY